MRAVLALLLLSLTMLAACGNETGRAGACVEHIFEGDEFTTCTYDPASQEFRLVWLSPSGVAPYRSFRSLSADYHASTVAFAMNAGMYDATSAPIGLYIEKGRELRPVSTTDGPGNFHLKPNGVFWIDATGAPHVTATDAYIALKPAPAWATQSGPMLVIDGTLHPAFDADGASRNIRNGVGVDEGGKAWFVISEQPISFGKFARFFRDSLHASDALYLDGAVSSLWDPQAGRKDTSHPLGPIVLVCAPSC